MFPSDHLYSYSEVVSWLWVEEIQLLKCINTFTFGIHDTTHVLATILIAYLHVVCKTLYINHVLYIAKF